MSLSTFEQCTPAGRLASASARRRSNAAKITPPPLALSSTIDSDGSNAGMCAMRFAALEVRSLHDVEQFFEIGIPLEDFAGAFHGREFLFGLRYRQIEPLFECRHVRHLRLHY